MEPTQRPPVLDALEQFVHTPLDVTLARHHERDPESAALDLFHQVARRVPAYAAFLAESGVDPAAVTTSAAFRRLPRISKQNYLSSHPLAALCWNGRLAGCDMVAVSSGSTGRPTFWPRALADELQIATRFEQVFRDSFHADTRRTLAVVCFALGTWVGGMYTASCCRYLAAKGYPVTVVTPGNQKEEIFRVVSELGPAFEQVVLLGYPPAIKDIIDSGRARGIDWAPYKVKLVLAGEVFSEAWRTLLGERTGGAAICYDSAALYGTADAGVLAVETPLSICVRRFLARQPAAARALFGEARLPTLAQYDPLSRHFECDDGALSFSGDSGVPLVRYNILDHGGLVPYRDMLAFLASYGFDPLAELGVGARGVRDLPFVFVFGRSDFTVSYFGANIYPENVTVGLEQPAVSGFVTGKFVLEAVEDADHDRFLSISVELAPGEAANAGRRDAVADAILVELLRLNSEFAAYVPPAAQRPRVDLCPFGDSTQFPVGVKHRYTRRRSHEGNA
ncbi:MAG: phenylacetate--CoA ligase family protein [Chloroflexales bacterium]|nr:phenylacetate--CoA ligase family protein [Chloroflexales bacterium]